MDTIKKLWWLAFPAGYGVMAIIIGIAVKANDGATPILSGLLWPIPLIRMLFGGGPLGG